MFRFRYERDEYIKEMVKFRDENTELKCELSQVDQMICNSEVRNAEAETN